MAATGVQPTSLPAGVRPATAVAVDAPAGGPWRQALRRLAGDRRAKLASGILAALALASLLAPLLAPYDPSAQPDIIALRSQPPSLAHPFGTDAFSRDVLSRVLHGGRVSLGVATLAVLVAASVGTAWGAVAGYVGGRVDSAMMRVVDALLSVPRVLLLIAALALWGRLSLPALIALLGFTGWFGVSRLVRAEVLATARRDYVTAARALGAGHARLLIGHMLPNALAPVIVAATLGVGNTIVLEAGLSYLGLGVQQPRASWGNIIQDGAEQIASQWWLAVFPGLAIVVTVLSLNALGDALRDAMDPRQLPRR